MAGLMAGCVSATAQAMDFRSVASAHVVMFDAPSAQARKVYIVSQYTPVEVIVNLGEWLKVRDSSGELAWLEAKSLNSRRTVAVSVPHGEVRETADTGAALVFRVDKDVVLDLLEPAPAGWAKVRHRDGLTGYIPATQVWGL